MRDAVEQCVPLDEPFTWTTVGNRAWSGEDLQVAFSSAGVIEVQYPESQSISAVTKGASQPGDMISPPASTTIKVSKVGALNRKDDIGLRGRKNAFRKWRTWSVLLTGSQLLFYRDSSLAEHVLRVLEVDTSGNDRVFESMSRAGLVKPDEIVSVKDAIAVYDRTYSKVSVVTFGLSLSLMKAKAQSYDPIRAIRWSSISPASFKHGRHGRMVDQDQLCQRFQVCWRADTAVGYVPR